MLRRQPIREPTREAGVHCWGSTETAGVRSQSPWLFPSSSKDCIVATRPTHVVPGLRGREVHNALLVKRVRSQWVRRASHLLVDPREIGVVVMEETRDGIHQHGVGRSSVETAGFFEGQ